MFLHRLPTVSVSSELRDSFDEARGRGVEAHFDCQKVIHAYVTMSAH